MLGSKRPIVMMNSDTQEMSRDDFARAQHRLGLSDNRLSSILNVDARTLRRWKSHADSGRDPNPVAVRVMGWMLDGWIPPEWPATPRGGGAAPAA
jgi:hypothetical protein